MRSHKYDPTLFHFLRWAVNPHDDRPYYGISPTPSKRETHLQRGEKSSAGGDEGEEEEEGAAAAALAADRAREAQIIFTDTSHCYPYADKEGNRICERYLQRICTNKYCRERHCSLQSLGYVHEALPILLSSYPLALALALALALLPSLYSLLFSLSLSLSCYNPHSNHLSSSLFSLYSSPPPPLPYPTLYIYLLLSIQVLLLFIILSIALAGFVYDLPSLPAPAAGVGAGGAEGRGSGDGAEGADAWDDDYVRGYYSTYSQAVWNSIVMTTSSSFPSQIMPCLRQSRLFSVFAIFFVTVGAFVSKGGSEKK